jgi:hypothetical protein
LNEPDIPVASLAALEVSLRVTDFTALEIQIARLLKFIVEYFVANPPCSGILVGILRRPGSTGQI